MKSKSVRTLCATLALTAAVSAVAAVPGIERKNQAAAERWADSVYNTLTERQRVAQLMFPTVNPADGEASKNVIKRYVSTDRCGGLLFSKGSLDQYATMIN